MHASAIESMLTSYRTAGYVCEVQIFAKFANEG